MRNPERARGTGKNGSDVDFGRWPGNSGPLGIGTISPATASASGGTTLTIRGSSFQSATTVFINGKAATVSFKAMNTLTVVTPSIAAGSQQLTITNPDGETVSLDAAITVN